VSRKAKETPKKKWQLYRASHPWANHLRWARRRCRDPKHSAFKFYGGKGIGCYLTVQEVKTIWERDKAIKLSQPSLDRRDSSKPYCFENCRFIELFINTSKPHKRSLICEQRTESQE
jgi:hypothetical protein